MSSLAFALLFSRPLASDAAFITVPADLNPGDQYRHVFATSATCDAAWTDIADHNNFISAVAADVPELAALETTWTAIASVYKIDAHDNSGTNPTVSTGMPIYRVDDERIADDYASIWDGDSDEPNRV